MTKFSAMRLPTSCGEVPAGHLPKYFDWPSVRPLLPINKAKNKQTNKPRSTYFILWTPLLEKHPELRQTQTQEQIYELGLVHYIFASKVDVGRKEFRV